MGYIYKITNMVNGKSYIGQSIHEPENGRINYHLRGYSKGNTALHRAISKYGRENFVYEILHENIIPELLDGFEDEAINTHNTLAPNGYNLRRGGSNGALSLETRRKISEKHKGKKLSLESRRKISESRKGIPSPKGMLGKKHSAETLKKMSESRKGKVPSPETLQKISKAHKGKKLSIEHRKKLSKARMGKKLSKEHLQKLIDSNTGKHSLERIKKRIHPYIPQVGAVYLSMPDTIPLRKRREFLYKKFSGLISKRTIRNWTLKWHRNRL